MTITACKTGSQFDPKAALGKLDGDAAFLRDLALLFLDTLPERLDALNSAMEERNSQRISDVAHSIKGSLRFFVADAAFDAAQRLESDSISGQPKADVDDACCELLEELRVLRLELLFFLSGV